MKDFSTTPTQQSFINLPNLVTKGVSWNQTPQPSGPYMILGQPILPGGGGGGRRRGRCKWFNVAKGWGFVTPDDGTQDVFVHQSVVHKSGFRSLADGEEVEFESKPSDKGVEATFVCGPSGSECRGSDRRPLSRKKFRKISVHRCYNCGDLGNHIAAKCPHGPLPKRCHNCKSVDHLIAECPMKEPVKRTRNDTNGGGASGMGNGHDTDHGSNMFYPV